MSIDVIKKCVVSWVGGGDHLKSSKGTGKIIWALSTTPINAEKLVMGVSDHRARGTPTKGKIEGHGEEPLVLFGGEIDAGRSVKLVGGIGLIIIEGRSYRGKMGVVVLFAPPRGPRVASDVNGSALCEGGSGRSDNFGTGGRVSGGEGGKTVSEALNGRRGRGGGEKGGKINGEGSHVHVRVEGARRSRDGAGLVVNGVKGGDGDVLLKIGVVFDGVVGRSVLCGGVGGSTDAKETVLVIGLGLLDFGSNAVPDVVVGDELEAVLAKILIKSCRTKRGLNSAVRGGSGVSLKSTKGNFARIDVGVVGIGSLGFLRASFHPKHADANNYPKGSKKGESTSESFSSSHKTRIIGILLIL